MSHGNPDFAVLQGDHVVRWAKAADEPIAFNERLLPVVEGEQPVAGPGERVHGPNYQVTSEMVIAYYWVEAIA